MVREQSASYVLGEDIDLDEVEIYEPDGTRLTEARATDIAENTMRQVTQS